MLKPFLMESPRPIKPLKIESIKGLENAKVPQVALQIFKTIEQIPGIY